ncbi:hypothetical protein [Hirschia baltica]|uniref:hypothetical protein n=1 Tax=Hirschia baltica TaxID=2724 RepID=UPI00059B9226|nr:hypothetical protein [Hirschia baltica]
MDALLKTFGHLLLEQIIPITGYRLPVLQEIVGGAALVLMILFIFAVLLILMGVFAGDRKAMERAVGAFIRALAKARHRVLETGIIQGGSFNASLEIALEASEFFELALTDAKKWASQLATSITANWKQALRDEGVTTDDVQTYCDAFEYSESESALLAYPTGGT